MKLTFEQGLSINFRKTVMVFKARLIETNNAYSTILMTHPPLVGPALHLHPEGAETFFILKGDYTFTLNENIIEAKEGDFILIPKNEPHKYKSGSVGGEVLVTTPTNVENYFRHIAEKLLEGEVSLDYEFEFAKNNGQIFLDKSEHWGHK
jgi:quercetin dioxygenase-like cupin family protein